MVATLKQNIQQYKAEFPKLEAFQLRGNAKKTIVDFYSINHTSQTTEQIGLATGVKSLQDKQSFGFLYVINGSGLGKTWMGHYACDIISEREIKENRKILRLHLDFINGNE